MLAILSILTWFGKHKILQMAAGRPQGGGAVLNLALLISLLFSYAISYAVSRYWCVRSSSFSPSFSCSPSKVVASHPPSFLGCTKKGRHTSAGSCGACTAFSLRFFGPTFLFDEFSRHFPAYCEVSFSPSFLHLCQAKLDMFFPLHALMLSHSSGRFLQSIASLFTLLFTCAGVGSHVSPQHHSFVRQLSQCLILCLTSFWACMENVSRDLEQKSVHQLIPAVWTRVGQVFLVSYFLQLGFNLFDQLSSSFAFEQTSVDGFMVPSFFPLFFRIVPQIDLHPEHDWPVVLSAFGFLPAAARHLISSTQYTKSRCCGEQPV